MHVTDFAACDGTQWCLKIASKCVRIDLQPRVVMSAPPRLVPRTTCSSCSTIGRNNGHAAYILLHAVLVVGLVIRISVWLVSGYPHVKWQLLKWQADACCNLSLVAWNCSNFCPLKGLFGVQRKRICAVKMLILCQQTPNFQLKYDIVRSTKGKKEWKQVVQFKYLFKTRCTF